MFLNALKNLFTSKTTNKLSKKGIRRRLELLGLEQRVVPANITVINNSDSGAGSLRQAILDANATVANDIIDFNFATGSSPYTITLAAALPSIATTSTAGTLTINGLGSSSLTIDGSQGGFSIFTISNGGDLSISGVTVSGANNYVSTVGGAFYNDGTLTITNATLSGNKADYGGAIYNTGTLTLNNSTLSNNNGDFGAGIINGGISTITNSTISGNSAGRNGGGIYNSVLSTISITNSTISGNSAQKGGGIYNRVNSTALNITNTIIANSTSGGDYFGSGAGGIITNNLVEDGSLGGAITGDPLLGPLQNNGGPTFTMALGVGSPAIATASASISNAAPVNGLDQRGYVRSTTAPSIGAYEFNGIAPSPESDFTFNSSTGVITGYTGPGGAVIIPSTIGGTPVLGIGTNAFFIVNSLTSVIIPNSVTSIGDGAFFNCTALTSVTIGNSVTSIGNNSFRNCASLTSVTIGNSVTSIGDAAFEGCPSLASVTFLGNAPTIGNNVFTNIASGAIAYRAANLTGYGADGSNFNGLVVETTPSPEADFTFNSTTGFITGYTGPGGAVVIPSTIGGTPVVGIGTYAFLGVTSLTSVLIPSSVTTLQDAAFYGCTSLTSVTIPNTVTRLGDYNTFFNCTALVSVTIGSGVTSTGSGTFYGCSALVNVVIPSGITNIGDGTFANCSSLTSVTFLGNAPTVGINPFSGVATGATAFRAANLTGYGADGDNFYGLIVATTPSPEADFTFNSSTGVITGYTGPGGAVVIPSTIGGTPVVGIGSNAFANNSSLTSVIIPNSVTSIGDGAFFNCTALTSVTIGNSVTSIGNGAFHYCASLTSLTIGNSVTSIGFAAFESCTSLASVTIPSSVTLIDGNAFTFCTNLASVTFLGNAPTIGNNAVFIGVPSGATAFRAANLTGYGADGSNFNGLVVETPGTFTVTNNSDSGTGSLRQAIINANTTAGNDQINFSLTGSSSYTITLAAALPNIVDANAVVGAGTAGTVTITGLGASSLIIDANQGSYSIFTINTGADFTISGVTVTGANTSGNGGAFNNQGNLTVDSSIISDNNATIYGGGIFSNGNLTVTNSTISRNASFEGGGVFNTGTLAVTNSTLYDNTAYIGGGISNSQGILTVSNSTLSGNSASGAFGFGGGIYNRDNLTITNSTISGNSATSGGGIYNNSGAINIANTIIANSISGGDFAGNQPVSSTNNLVEDGSISGAIAADPLLGPLQDNGGPTFTMALFAGSPAIGAADGAISNTAPVNGLDQRGYVRSSTTPSIGAYEFLNATQVALTTPASGSDYMESQVVLRQIEFVRSSYGFMSRTRALARIRILRAMAMMATREALPRALRVA